jgi:hypothetical protein
MATSTSTTSTVSPQAAALAALQAALANTSAGSAPSQQAVLAALQAGKPYTLRQVAAACGYKPRKRSNGKLVWQPLRSVLRKLVAAGSAVTVTAGGYVGINGGTVGGTAYYMAVPK